MKLLAENPPDPHTSPPLDDDWLNLFTSLAEKATTERTQKHWASVLAGEIRQPGSFSYAALHILSVMDQTLAKQVAEAKPWIYDSGIPFTKSLREGAKYSTLLALEPAGIISVAGIIRRTMHLRI